MILELIKILSIAAVAITVSAVIFLFAVGYLLKFIAYLI